MPDEELAVRWMHTENRATLVRITVGLMISFARPNWLKIGSEADQLPANRPRR